MDEAQSQDRLVECLACCPLFSGWDAGLLRALAGHFTVETLPEGAAAVTEGGTDRDLYAVVDGAVQFTRHGVDLGRVERGALFGELALVAGRARAATVAAVSPVTLGRLSHQAFVQMQSTQPALAFRLLAALVAAVGQRLTDMTDNVGALLKERSLPRRTSITVECDGTHRSCSTGTQLRNLLPRQVDNHPVVAALLDSKPVSLVSTVSSDCRLAPLTTATLEGQRIYQHSLRLLLLEAILDVAPELQPQVVGSLGGASRLALAGGGPPDLADLANRVQARMAALVAEDTSLAEELWTVEEAREHFRRVGWDDVVALLATWRQAAVPLATYGRVYTLALTPLAPSTGLLARFRVLAQDGHLILVDRLDALDRIRQTAARLSDRRGQHERWLNTLGVRHVGAFNQTCVAGEVAQLIRVSEGAQEKRVSQIADMVVARMPQTRVVCIAGPSSAGKTTFIRRLKVQLQVEGINPIGLGLDDYYVDRDRTPRDDAGAYDFERLDALDLPMLRQHLGELLAGNGVHTARYDFKRGLSIPQGGPTVRLGSRDVLMLEGIHGLNPDLFTAPDPQAVFRVFVCPRAQLAFDRITRVRASDVRLLRRVVRDRHNRGTSTADNIQRWTSVRDGEQRHIFPFEHHADAVFDSSLIYELAVLKVYAERYLLEVPQDHAAYPTAFRLLGLLDRFVTIYPDHVPPTSLLREFTGGSGFDY